MAARRVKGKHTKRRKIKNANATGILGGEGKRNWCGNFFFNNPGIILDSLAKTPEPENKKNICYSGPEFHIRNARRPIES